MKKLLLIILLGFALTSIFAFGYTNLVIATFSEFEEDNGNGEDDENDAAISCSEFPKSSSQTSLNIIWNKTYGGEYVDVSQSIINCSTGGFVISGWTNSSGAGDLDIWILRIDDNGDHIWNRTFGGIEEDKGFEITEYSSGGFAVAATLTNTTALYDNNDFSVIRIADDGNLIWQKNYSGPEQTDVSIISDLGRSIVECPNGDLTLAGVTRTAIGESDCWLFRIGPNGFRK